VLEGLVVFFDAFPVEQTIGLERINHLQCWVRKRVRRRIVYPDSVRIGESLQEHVLPPEPPTFRCGELSDKIYLAYPKGHDFYQGNNTKTARISLAVLGIGVALFYADSGE
jgi:hypothetical protein